MCRLRAVLAVLVVTTSPAPARDEAPTIEPREVWSNVFADREVTFRFAVTSAKAWRGRAAWSLAAENDRILDRGEADVAADAKKPQTVTIKLRAPEVKTGVVLKTRLRVRLVAGAGTDPVATLDRPVWVFPDDPFVNRRDWLKGLKISLFDPEKTTAGPLRKLDVPFEPVHSVAVLREVKEGLLLVGASVSFKDHPDLAEALITAAAKGLPVLCLSPVGVMTLPGTDPRGPRPRTITWRRSDHITTLDSRLDATAWLPDGKVVNSTVALKADNAEVVIEGGPGEDGWPWFETEFGKKGRLIVCGFGLMGRAWDAGPTPRYLFARMLEVLTDRTEESKDRATNR